jgi:serine/threonine protein kinase
LIGRLIANRYRIESFLGKGGMAEVYKVWDEARSVPLAMKILHADMAEDKVFLRRFRREAQTLETLQHPNIVRFYGLGQSDGLVFLLMEYVEGTTLRKEIFDTDAPFSMKRVLGVMQPVTAALHYAHQSGFVHCDVKPANIMLHKSGNILVADFGISRMSESATVTMAGVGTPAYMSPEQIKGDMPTPQMDIYAMGVLLFEMATGGERPFTGENARFTAATTEKIRWEQRNLEAPSPRDYNPSISPALEKVVLTCLQKQPSARYKTALDLYTILNKISDAASSPRAIGEVGVSRVMAVEENKDAGSESLGIAPMPVSHEDVRATQLGKKTRPNPLRSEIAKKASLGENLLSAVFQFSKSISIPAFKGDRGVYFSSNRTGKIQIYLIGKDGLKQVTATSNNFEAARSSNGIYFTSDQSGKKEVFHMSERGEVEQITYTSGSAESWNPKPFGNGIYFSSDRSGKAEIYYSDSAEIKKVTDTPGDYVSLHTAPTSTGFYFSSNRSGKMEIFFTDHNGIITQVTYTRSGESKIAAPFYNGLYFVSTRDGENQEIYYMDSKRIITQITKTSGNVVNLNPLPASNGLYFISNRTGVFELYHLDKNSNLLQVTKSPENTFSFIGSPP